MKTATLAGAFLLWATASFGVTRCVAPTSPSSGPPYTNWYTAATTIQAAVDASVDHDLVLVSNGYYSTGGVPTPGGGLTSRVVVTKGITLQSVNGPDVTTIAGRWDPLTGGLGSNAARCIYVSHTGAVVSGFTLQYGHTYTNNTAFPDVVGGGALMTEGILSNCIVQDCRALMRAGGLYAKQVYSCKIVGNSALDAGGVCLSGNDGVVLENSLVISNQAAQGAGAYFISFGVPGRIRNCTIVRNTASSSAGGIYFNTGAPSPTGTVWNSIVLHNTGPLGSNYYGFVAFDHSCTLPLPPGSGNITNDPRFVDLAAGDVHLRAGSPCIEAGTNIQLNAATDMDGQPRFFGAALDIGADEAVIQATRIEREKLLGADVEIEWDLLFDLEYVFQVASDGAGTNWWDLTTVLTSLFNNTTLYITSSDPVRRFRIQTVGP